MAAASPAGGVGNEACFSRLQKEYTHLLRDPVPGVLAHPSPSSLLEWHYIISFEGGARDGEPARAATNGCTGTIEIYTMALAWCCWLRWPMGTQWADHSHDTLR